MNGRLELSFSAAELRILRIWAESTIHGGHWGDGAVILPDEAAALDLLETLSPDLAADCLPRQIFTFLVWSGESSDTPEETILKEKLERALAGSGMSPPVL